MFNTPTFDIRKTITTLIHATLCKQERCANLYLSLDCKIV